MLCHFMWIFASWTSGAVYFLEAVEVAAKQGVAYPQLKNKAGHALVNPVVAD